MTGTLAGFTFAQFMALLQTVTAPVFALKQVINVVQLANACNKVVQFDIRSKQA